MYNPLRYTPLVFLYPKPYIGTGYSWENFDIHEWSNEKYEWKKDAINGFLDFATNPNETVRKGYGDCEDYALVALSWINANGRYPCGLAYLGNGIRIEHMIAYDSDNVYSSGSIFEDVDPEEYKERSEYSWIKKRDI